MKHEKAHATAARAAFAVPSLSLRATQDPSQSLRYLRARSGDVRKLGRQRIRGVETTHYSTTVDAHKLPDTFPKDKRSDAKRSVDRLIALTGSSKFPTQVWIDRPGYVRRQRVELSLRAPDRSRQRLLQQFDFYDFGVRARILPPPAAEVQDATALATRQPPSP